MSSKPSWSRHAYSTENALQSYDFYIPTSKSQDRGQVWVIYIHGGYFRDPDVLADSFHATVAELESPAHANAVQQVAGYATINYRLSKHSDRTQPPETSPHDLRDAHWPQHLDDVMSALQHLQHEYKFGSDYLLVGHSVGAQMALLAALQAKNHNIQAPKVVLGLSGIYDFPLIHKDLPTYKEMTFTAMEQGEEGAASPALRSAKEYEEAGVQKMVLGHSKDDGLVPWNQFEVMLTVIPVRTEGMELFGGHNDIWKDGKESARAVLKALEDFPS